MARATASEKGASEKGASETGASETGAGETGERRLGTLLVLASAAVFALAGTLTKSNGADPWTIACWRGLVGAGLIAAYVLVRRRKKPLRDAFALGRDVWLIAAVGAAGSIAFIASFKATHVANVAVIYAAAPFLAAILDRVLRAEPFSGRTMAAASVSFAGVALIVAGGLGAGNLAGDALALLMTALCALYLVLIRAYRDAPVVWAGALSGLILFSAGWLAADPLAISGRDVALVAAFGVSFAVAVILWTEGARLIPAAEAGLLGAAEIPCAALFAFAFLGETPPLASFAGGAIVLAAVVWNSGGTLRAGRRRPRRAGTEGAARGGRGSGMEFRKIDDEFAVAGQIGVAQVPAIAAAGFRSLVCNRPDSEAGAVAHDEIAMAARSAGLEFRFIPVVSGAITEENVTDMAAALDALPKPVLAYCRSGARCLNLYGLVRQTD